MAVPGEFSGTGAKSRTRGVAKSLTATQRNGITTRIVVPRRGALSNSNLPFSCVARSRIVINPRPPDVASRFCLKTHAVPARR
jgi:hypothetical protein